MDDYVEHPSTNVSSVAGHTQLEVGTLRKFDQETVRKALMKMIVLDELPFRFVENEGFRLLISVACPRFSIPSRWTVARDCLELFKYEKEKLMDFFAKSNKRICLTTDTWTSNQNIKYMVLTGHYIDDDWKLQKRILNFVPCPSHKGKDMTFLIEQCLREWGIKKIFTITVDNASSNNGTCKCLKERFGDKGNTLVCGGDFLHMRCVPHIINLAVQECMSEQNDSIKRVRAVVKFIKLSPVCERKFKKCAEEEGILTKKFLSLDVPTRWNSIYKMLDAAVDYQKAFERYELCDPQFQATFTCNSQETIDVAADDFRKETAPNSYDWLMVNKMVKCLSIFYELTTRVSSSSYVTSNTFLDDLNDVVTVLRKYENDSKDQYLRKMGANMMKKFDSYWGDTLKMNPLLFMAPILDPRLKFSYVQCSLIDMYPEVIGKDPKTKEAIILGDKLAKKTMKNLEKLYSAYKEEFGTPSTNSSHVAPTVEMKVNANVGMSDLEKTRLERMRKYTIKTKDSATKSDLQKYLNEDCIIDEDFEILNWWKVHSQVYPILSKLAADIFAMPISTMSSESAFSIGGRVISDFRSLLSTQSVQALICCQDWTRQERTDPFAFEEDVPELEKLENDLFPLLSINDDC